MKDAFCLLRAGSHSASLSHAPAVTLPFTGALPGMHAQESALQGPPVLSARADGADGVLGGGAGGGGAGNPDLLRCAAGALWQPPPPATLCQWQGSAVLSHFVYGSGNRQTCVLAFAVREARGYCGIR